MSAAQVDAVLDVIQTHRRVRNVRSCTGCDWHPARSGRTGDPDDTRARHDDFNRHLAELIVTASVLAPG